MSFTEYAKTDIKIVYTDLEDVFVDSYAINEEILLINS